MEKEDIIVCIKCWVFNHEQYLRECLDGFVMQKTDFRFVAVVHDDCSTDGSSAIIREYAEKYPDIIKPIYETENQYSKHDGSLGRIMDAEMAKYAPKYIAMCEGDDYWTDPYKLQKQVDYMEEHEEYGMMCSPSQIYNQSEGKFIGIKGKPGDEIFENLFHGHSDLFTATILVRKSIYEQYVEESKNLIPFMLSIDTAIYYWFALNSKIYHMDESTAVYRVLQNSACHSDNPRTTLKMMQRYLDVKIAFLSYCKGFSDEKYTYMMQEIRDYEQQVIDYAQYIKELEIRQSKSYRLGNMLLKPFIKK